MDKITFDPLHDIAYKRIVDAIRSGTFQQGQILKTRDLAETLGISSTPVREALTRLTSQRVLELAPRARGVAIPRLTRDVLDEMYELRLHLEPMAAERAAKAITEQELAQLEQTLDKMKALKGNEESAEFRDRSEEFAMQVFSASHKPILIGLIENLWLRSHVILGVIRKPRPKGFSLMKQREDCLKALRRGDGAAAAAAVRDILTRTRDMIQHAMDDAGI